MIERRPYTTLSGDRRDWLNARHHIAPAPPSLAAARRRDDVLRRMLPGLGRKPSIPVSFSK